MVTWEDAKGEEQTPCTQNEPLSSQSRDQTFGILQGIEAKSPCVMLQGWAGEKQTLCGPSTQPKPYPPMKTFPSARLTKTRPYYRAQWRCCQHPNERNKDSKDRRSHT